jgi:hypothetical protein
MRRVNQPLELMLVFLAKLLSSMSRNARSIADVPEVLFEDIYRNTERAISSKAVCGPQGRHIQLATIRRIEWTLANTLA